MLEAEFRDQRERVLAGEHDVKDFLRESALEEKAHARALQTMVPVEGTNLASRVLPGQVLTSNTSTPVAAGWPAYFSSSGRKLVTNGSAFSTITSRREPRNGKVCSSSWTAAKSDMSPG